MAKSLDSAEPQFSHPLNGGDFPSPGTTESEKMVVGVLCLPFTPKRVSCGPSESTLTSERSENINTAQKQAFGRHLQEPWPLVIPGDGAGH